MLGKYKITINVEIERATDPDESIVKGEESQIPDEYPNCGCNCDICSLDNSDDSDNEDENDGENNEDDNIDYDKYDKGWDCRDIDINKAIDNHKGPVGTSFGYKDISKNKPIQLRNDYGQFSHGNTPIAKRGPDGRFIKS